MAITGASGLIGRRLCEHFSEGGWSVRALLRRPEQFDLEAVESFAFEMPTPIAPELLRGVQVLVHCAATTRSRDLQGSRHVDVEGSRALFLAAREAGVERIVFLSSISARPGAPSRYGRDKLAIEGLLDPRCDLALRLGLVLSAHGGGLFQRLVGWIRHLPIIPLFGGGAQLVQPLHLDDLCLGLQLALEKQTTGSVVLGDPAGLAFRELLEEVAHRLGRRPLFLPLPYGPALLSLRALELLRLPLPISSENLLGLRAQQFMASSGDLSRIGLQLRSLDQSLDEVLKI